MLALIRPDAWNLPLFLHVLGATVLFGTVGVVTAAGFAIRTHGDHQALLTRVAQRTYLLGVIPAYIVMRVAAQWIDGKEFPNGGEPGWVGVGFLVSDAGVVLFGHRRDPARGETTADPARRAGADGALRARARRRVGLDVRQALTS